MASVAVLTKDPGEVLDYSFIWSVYLRRGESISSASVTVTTGITLSSYTNTSNTVTAWVAGGTANVDYYIYCTIVTDQGRTAKRSIKLEVVTR